jgi:hypothetical protein
VEGAPADLNVVRNFVFNSVLDLHQTPSKICQRLSEGRVQVRTWGRVKELVFRCAGVALVRDRDEGVKNTFEGRERTRPTVGEGLAVNRQFAEQIPHRMVVEIEVLASRGAGNRHRWIACLGKSEARLIEPVANQHSEMLPGAGALDFLLRGQQRMPSEDLEAVQPAVLDHQEPAFVPVGDEATNRAREAFCEQGIH